MHALPELVGRDAVLASGRAALARAADGRGGLVLVSGEAGIGKSALARVLVREAEHAGALVVVGAAWELGEAPAYFPLRPAFSAIGLDAGALASEGNPFHVWEKLLAALARSAAERLVVLLVEDVHAADLATLDLLTLLAQPLAGLRALVLATARLKDPRITERVGQRLTRMLRDGEHVALEPLGAEAIRALAERTLGRSMSDAALGELVSRTGGNALFVVECAQALRASGTSASGLPGTVRQIVLDRVRLLPEATAQTLAAAAVVGRTAHAFVVAGVLGRLPAQIIDALEPALRAGLVEESEPGRFTFPHILVRDAIEEALPGVERRKLHAAASDALARLEPSVDVLVERARHALDAQGEHAAGAELGVRAAAELERQGAFDRAHVLYQRVAEARRAGLAPPATPEARLHEARVAQTAGRFSEARRACLEVVQTARDHGDAPLFAEAALAYGAEIRPGVVDRELVALLEEAKARLGEPLSALRVRVLARLAAALQPAPDPAVPVALAREALGLAHALGDEAALIDVLFVAGAALVDFNPLDERLAVSDELARRALVAGDLVNAARGYGRVAMASAEHGDFKRFSDAVERVLALTDELGVPRHRWRGLLLASMRALAQGDVGASDRAVREVRELEAVSDDPTLSLALLAHTQAAAALLHRDDELRHFTRALRLPRDLANSAFLETALRAAYFARLEDREATAAELARLAPVPRVEQGSFFQVFVAQAQAFVGDVAACRRARETITSEGTPHVVGGHVPMTYEGPRERVLGILDSVLGDHAQAESKLRNALAVVTAAGFLPWIAQLEDDLGQALERAGQRAEAAACFARAAAHAADVPMPGLVERASARHARLTGTEQAPPSTSVPAARRPTALGLFRQGELWRLEFDGRTLTLRHSRGLELLARLVERAGQEIHVLALASDEPGSSLEDDIPGAGIDEQARRAYRQRLTELELAVAEAERAHDLGRSARLEREREALAAELERAFGLGGRARRSGSASERARVNVQRRLKDALARIGELDPECGRFLGTAVRTGNYCLFVP
jgi:tetratricopeptide (TPR) repeat protein